MTPKQEKIVAILTGRIREQRQDGVSDSVIRANLISHEGWVHAAVSAAFDRAGVRYTEHDDWPDNAAEGDEMTCPEKYTRLAAYLIAAAKTRAGTETRAYCCVTCGKWHIEEA